MSTIKTKERFGSMNLDNKLKLQKRHHRRFFWLFAVAAVAALLFEKQVAVLLVIWTLTICGLLIAATLSSLEAKDAEMQIASIGGDAAHMRTNPRNFKREERRAANRPRFGAKPRELTI
ncbi:MAG: hypothetical protein ACT4OT_17805 [Acidobacteriota bacterium]